MTYDEIIAQLQILGAIPQNSEDSNFQKLVPLMMHYADGRIYRDLNFLATDTVTPVTLTPLEREILLPSNVLTVRSIGICTPPGPPTRNSRRHYPERISTEALDMFWPQPNSRPGIPKWYTVVGIRVPPTTLPSTLPPSTQPLPPIFEPERFIYAVHFGPSPDRAYTAEVFGGVEPEILSQSNPETFISVRYPELLIACCMVFITGYQRDYGAASDDPQRALSWNGQYMALKDGIAQEAGRQRGEGPSFTALPSSGVAQQPRSP